MIGVPIESIAILIAALIAALLVLSVYMVIARHRENRRSLQASAYLETNRLAWYDYLRRDGAGEEVLIPKNLAEVSAVEELFRSLVHNVRGDGMERRISSFSNRHLAGVYRKRLKGRNWGMRVNTLYRIHNFGVDALAADCRAMTERRVSNEEFFLLLLISMKFEPESFIREHLDRLALLSDANRKELLFTMPDNLFEETLRNDGNLDPSVRYTLIDVIGMKADIMRTADLARLFNSPDSEQRIRVLRAFNSLAVLPSSEICEAAAGSDIWQERYQAARMLKRMPQMTAQRLLPKFTEDTMFLVREEAMQFSGLPVASVIGTSLAQSAADHEFQVKQQSGSAEGERRERR